MIKVNSTEKVKTVLEGKQSTEKVNTVLIIGLGHSVAD
jgi:hypothetical protein